MSLGIAIKGPEGVVLAADSRVTLKAERPGESIPIYFDNVTKLLSFGEDHTYVGAVTYGQAVIGLRTAYSYIPEFEETVLKKEKKARLTINEFSKKLSDFFLSRWEKDMPKDYPGGDMMFIVAGYDEGSPYGRVFLFGIPKKPKPAEQQPKKDKHPGEEFGMTWGGQLQIASRIIHGLDPQAKEIIREKLKLDNKTFEMINEELRKLQWQIPWQILPLQDCIDLATNIIRITMAMQDVAITVRGVGGLIEIATITSTDGIRFVQKKRIHGEFTEDFYEDTIEGD